MEMCSLTNHCRPELTQSGTKSVHITNCFSTLCLSSDLSVRPLEKATVPAMWHELDDYSCWTRVVYFKTFRSFTSDCQLSDDASVWTDWSCLLGTVTCCSIFVISTSEYFSFLGIHNHSPLPWLQDYWISYWEGLIFLIPLIFFFRRSLVFCSFTYLSLFTTGVTLISKINLYVTYDTNRASV